MIDSSSDETLGEELVRIALGAAQHLPILVWAYQGPLEWLDEARRRRDSPESLVRRAALLRKAADSHGDAFISAQSESIIGQLDKLMGATSTLQDEARRLLGITDPRPEADEVHQLRTEVIQLAGELAAGDEPVRRWERDQALVGEAKWDAAIDAYVDGRRWVANNFPLRIVENLELGRDVDYHASVRLNWVEKSTLHLGINVDTPRTRETTRFEITHNAYPGDYLRTASLHQHAYSKQGFVSACIKLKNTPDSVISEGLEDTAYLRITPNPTTSDLLATKLEWLRRGVAATAAIMMRDEQASESVVAQYCSHTGFLADDRLVDELRILAHPVWSLYRLTYWPGRKLIMEADHRASLLPKPQEYFSFLFTTLHTPGGFLAEVDRFLAATTLAVGPQ